VESARPFVKKLIEKKKSPGEVWQNTLRSGRKLKDFVLGLPYQTQQLLARLKNTESNLGELHTDIKSLIVEMDRSSNRIALGMMIAGFIIAGSLLFSYNSTTVWRIPVLSFVCFVIALLLLFFLFISVVREKRR
jgi:ubiquinone biosynthesis protein